MKYQLFISFLFSINLASAMEHDSTPTQYERAFDETIGTVLAKEKGIDEEGRAAIEMYRKKLNGSSGDITELEYIRDDHISLENLSEYNKESAQLVKLWFKDKCKKKADHLYSACQAGMPELVSFFLDKIEAQDKNFTLYISVIEGCITANVRESKINEEKMQQKVKSTLTAHYFTLLKILRDAGVSTFYEFWPDSFRLISPLTHAVLMLKPEFVAFFLAAGVDLNNNYKNRNTIDFFNAEKEKALLNDDGDKYKDEIEQIENLFNRYIMWNNCWNHEDHKKNYYFSLLPKELLELFKKKLYGVEI